MISTTEIPQQVIGLFGEDTDPRPVMVTVRCTTYNHEPYIRQTLEGFMMQKTNFRFEAIVHDDASTDGTAAIIREYAEKYPDIIKPIYETENQYSKRDGSLGRIMDAATRGKYIAMCEGDDYWIDPLKLQKQFDFLESHPDYSLCHSAFDLIDDNGNKIFNPAHYYFMHIPKKKNMFCRLLYGNYIMTCTTFVRKTILDTDFRNNTDSRLDYILFLSAASAGYIHYDKTKMACYRRTSTGAVISRNDALSRELSENSFYAINQYINNKIAGFTILDNIKIKAMCSYLLYFVFLRQPNYSKKTRFIISQNRELKYHLPFGIILRIYHKIQNIVIVKIFARLSRLKKHFSTKH